MACKLLCLRSAVRIVCYMSGIWKQLHVRDMESLSMCSFRHLMFFQTFREMFFQSGWLVYIWFFRWFFQLFYSLWKLFKGSFSFVISLEWFFLGFFLEGVTYLVVMQCWAYRKSTFSYSVTVKKKFFFPTVLAASYQPAIFKSADSMYRFASLLRIFSDLRNKWYATIIRIMEGFVTLVYYELNQLYLPS
jgi:hypothetical protein